MEEKIMTMAPEEEVTITRKEMADYGNYRFGQGFEGAIGFGMGLVWLCCMQEVLIGLACIICGATISYRKYLDYIIIDMPNRKKRLRALLLIVAFAAGAAAFIGYWFYVCRTT